MGRWIRNGLWIGMAGILILIGMLVVLAVRPLQDLLAQ